MPGQDVEEALARAGAGRLRSGDPARIGPYVPLGHLGSGGMGRVYLARPADGRDGLAAVKVIRPEYAENAEFRRRFEREAAVLARVRSPHAPRLLHTGSDDLLWMATEYLPGPSLSEAVHEFGPLRAPGVWWLVGELGRALDELTAAQVVHRDLKPSNVILAAHGSYVIDFGISQAADASSITTTGKAVGTPAYMSPERLRDGRADVVSDVFSLACTLVFAATGRAPFGDGTGVDVMHRVAFEEPYGDVIEELVAADPDLADLLSACLAKDPALRPSPGQLVEAAAARPGPGHWQEPLNSQVLARQGAYEVLTRVPVEQTVHLRTPGAAAGAGAAAGMGAGAVATPTPAPASPPPMPTPVQTVPQRSGSPAAAPRGRKRRLYVTVGASFTVCAVALTAFLLTGQGDEGGPGGGSRNDNARATPGSSVSESAAPGPTGASGLSSPSSSGSSDSSEKGQGDESARPDASRSASASGADDRPTPSATEKPGGGGSSPSSPPKPSPSKPAVPPWISQCTYYSGTEITRYGDKGQRVVQVQCMLSKRGYGIGGAGVDGQFGDDTRAAVKKFQSSRGLAVDGEVGTNTWAALRSRT
ncbi:protein kinase [Streptomyces monticola]|uniref:Protein kinase n=1 Tax=Streptomyces monticola TaxID=2666263 RepID=A0ABW2JI27_9ACTN